MKVVRILHYVYLASFVVLAACSGPPPSEVQDTDPEVVMYVGTYTKETSAGIYAFRFDPSAGRAEPLGLAAEVREPSFLALHPNGDYLYAVSETDDFDSAGCGSVLSFAIDSESAQLTKLNEVSSGGGWPCHLSIDSGGRMLIVANYKGGSIASFPIDSDGTLGEAASFVQHAGSSVHSRQEQAHAHSADFSVDDRFAFFSDLGIDQVKVYRADTATAMLTPHDPPHVDVAPGSGPRHFALHPSARFAYGINELASTVTAYAFDAEAGVLDPVQTASTLPAEFQGENYTAEIRVHPSGRFVYATNRGHDSIAVFAVDEPTGRLESRGQVSSGGNWPRSFVIEPNGAYLLAANQNSDNIVILRIDQETGALAATGAELEIDAPVCIVFREA